MLRVLGFVAALALLAQPALANECFDYGSGDSPPILDSISISYSGGRVAVKDDLVMIVCQTSFEAQELHLYVFSAADPHNLVQIGVLNGFGGGGIQRSNELIVVGERIYFNTAFGFFGIDISDPTVPTVDFAVVSNAAGGMRIKDGYAWLVHGGVGLEAWDLSNPHSPQPVATVPETDFAPGIEVVGQYLYSVIRESEVDCVRVIDIADPLQPVVVTTLPVPNGVADNLFYWNGFVYYRDDNLALSALDAGDPAAPQLTGVSIAARPGALGYDYFAARGEALYMADCVGAVIFSVSDPGAPQLLGTFDSESGGYRAYSVAASADALYTYGREDPLLVGYLDCGSLTAVPVDGPAARAQVAAYPNPFNPLTRIEVRLSAAQPARVTIHDVQGRLLRELFTGELPAGVTRFDWQGDDDRGESLSSGLYTVRVSGTQERASARLTLLR